MLQLEPGHSGLADDRPDRSEPFGKIERRDQFDFDSMDMLNFAIGLNQEFGIEVPETTYRELATLRGAVEYVGRQLAAKESAGSR